MLVFFLGGGLAPGKNEAPLFYWRVPAFLGGSLFLACFKEKPKGNEALLRGPKKTFGAS